MNRKRFGGSNMRWAGLWIGVLLLCACAVSQRTGQNQGDSPDAPKGGFHVSAIIAAKTDRGETVTLKSADRLIFTSIKQPAPLSVILYVPGCQIEGEPQGILPDFKYIEDIQTGPAPEAADTARIEIRLKQDVPHEVNNGEEGLVVSFSDGLQPFAAIPSPEISSQDLPQKTQAEGVVSPPTTAPGTPQPTESIRFKSITRRSDAEVEIESSGKITSYSAFTLTHPPRIVVDVFNLKDRPLRKEKTIEVGSDCIKRIRYYGDEEKLRVVIDTHDRFLTQYQALSLDTGLRVRIDAAAVPAPKESPVVAAEPQPPAVPETPETDKPIAQAPKEKPAEAVRKPVVPERPESDKPIPSNPKFTGEKIALDFFDTDIRNVFRILGEVSQKNFAVDKDVAGRVSLKLSDPVPWDQVLDLVLKMNQLDKQVIDNVIRIATLTTLKTEEALKREVQQEEKKKKLSENLITEYIQVNYADAEKEVFPHIARFFNKEQVEKEEGSRVSYMIQTDAIIPGTVSVDTRNNVIIITSVPEMIERAKDIVRRVDRVTPQVMIEARIVEASTTFSRDIGIDWTTDGGISNDDSRAGIGPQRGFDRYQGTYGYDSAISLPVTGPTFGINFAKIIGSPFLLDAQLSAMEANDEGKIISSPRIMTLNNREAEIKQGEEVGYETRDDEGNIVVEFKEVDLVLKVTPQVTLDKRISLDIHVIKKEIVGYVQTSNGGVIPEISTKEANTKLLVNDGETIAIGGIAINKVESTDSGVPWLKDIPLLGWLFQKTGAENDKKELLIFMTPQIHQLEQRTPVMDDVSTISQKKS